MARDEDLSLAVLQGVGPSPDGLYQPSVLGRSLPLQTPDVQALSHNRAGRTLFLIVHGDLGNSVAGVCRGERRGKEREVPNSEA